MPSVDGNNAATSSGRQRVALMRTLIMEPVILLMDEPFGALDAQTRETMQEEVTRIWERTHKTVVFVTHDIEEAVFLGDRVIVLSARPGRIREEVRIELPRPRTVEMMFEPDFIELIREMKRTVESAVRQTVEVK